MLSAGIALGTATGCSIENYERKYLYNNDLYNKDIYLVVEEKGINVVHKGDYYAVVDDTVGYGAAGTGLLSLEFDCGRKLLTNADCYIYENKPTKDVDYYEDCEGCFSLDNILTN